MLDNTFGLNSTSDAEVSNFFNQVYSWMAGALAVSGASAWYIASNETLINLFLGNQALFFGIIIAEFALVIFLSWKAQKMSFSTAAISFLAYSVLSGITLASVFLVYTTTSITNTFFITAGTFLALSFYGYTTNRNLAGWGDFLIMSLIGIIIASVVNFFLQSPAIQWMVTYAGIVIFTGLIAYDTQKLKQIALSGGASSNLAILGALSLYLDFINLFLSILRAIGDRR